MIAGSQVAAAESLRERYRANHGRRCLTCGCSVAYDRKQSYCGAHYPKHADDQRGRPKGARPGRKLPGLGPIMERRGLSNADVVAASGLSGETVRNLKRLHTGASPEEWEALADALGVSKRTLSTRDAAGGNAGRPPGLHLRGLWAVMREAGAKCDGLGERVGVSGAHVSDLRRGKRGASPETAERIARALGVTVQELREKG